MSGWLSRRGRALLVATTISVVAFGVAEAHAATTAVTQAAVAPPNASCLTNRQAGTPMTMAEAQACAPGAVFVPSGVVSQSGEYIVPGHNGGYAILGVSSALSSVGGAAVTSRTALAYSCGQNIGRNISSYYWDPVVYVTFNTGNSAVYCSYAWNNWETPGGYVIGGTFTDSKGVINNHTYTENPWLNRTVVMNGGLGQDTFFCRHYYSANDQWSAWCS